ncbi:MAG: hypothetical protein WDW36_009359 [Sanguina aurantia]
MGIGGLLPVLKSISKPVHVRSYAGQRVAVDGYSWLHKGAYCCALELCEGLWTEKFVVYFMSRVDMLRAVGIEVVIIFDGCRLPMKADEEADRRRGRQENLDKGRAHLAAGNVSAATECFQRAAGVTSAMVKQTIEALRAAGVEFLVAPYEADAQLAYLAISRYVFAVITEDSDLLAYGCPRVLFKLDKHGNGEEIQLQELVLNKGLNFEGFTPDMFLATCILSGCDFLPNIPGLGVKKAHAAMRKGRSFSQVVRTLRFGGKTAVPRDYEASFQRVVWLFRHQRVFCRRAQGMVHLQPLPPAGLASQDVEVPGAVPDSGTEASELPFLGPHMPDHIAAGISTGALDPRTLAPHNLAAIYRGCPNPPAHLREALGLPPLQHQPPRRNSTNSLQQQQRSHSSSQVSAPVSQTSGGGASQGRRQSSGSAFVQGTGSSGSQVSAPRGAAGTWQQTGPQRPLSTGGLRRDGSNPVPIPKSRQSISSYFSPIELPPPTAFAPPRPMHAASLKPSASAPANTPAQARPVGERSGTPEQGTHASAPAQAATSKRRELEERYGMVGNKARLVQSQKQQRISESQPQPQQQPQQQQQQPQRQQQLQPQRQQQAPLEASTGVRHPAQPGDTSPSDHACKRVEPATDTSSRALKALSPTAAVAAAAAAAVAAAPPSPPQQQIPSFTRPPQTASKARATPPHGGGGVKNVAGPAAGVTSMFQRYRLHARSRGGERGSPGKAAALADVAAAVAAEQKAAAAAFETPDAVRGWVRVDRGKRTASAPPVTKHAVLLNSPSKRAKHGGTLTDVTNLELPFTPTAAVQQAQPSLLPQLQIPHRQQQQQQRDQQQRQQQPQQREQQQGQEDNQPRAGGVDAADEDGAMEDGGEAVQDHGPGFCAPSPAVRRLNGDVGDVHTVLETPPFRASTLQPRQRQRAASHARSVHSATASAASLDGSGVDSGLGDGLDGAAELPGSVDVQGRAALYSENSAADLSPRVCVQASPFGVRVTTLSTHITTGVPVLPRLSDMLRSAGLAAARGRAQELELSGISLPAQLAPLPAGLSSGFGSAGAGLLGAANRDQLASAEGQPPSLFAHLQSQHGRQSQQLPPDTLPRPSRQAPTRSLSRLQRPGPDSPPSLASLRPSRHPPPAFPAPHLHTSSGHGVQPSRRTPGPTRSLCTGGSSLQALDSSVGLSADSDAGIDLLAESDQGLQLGGQRAAVAVAAPPSRRGPRPAGFWIRRHVTGVPGRRKR